MENEKKVMTPEVIDMNNIDPALFKKNEDHDLHDQAFETKPVSYLKDCFKRFCKNKASIVAAIIIALIALYAIIVPIASPKSYVNSIDYPKGFMDDKFAYVLPYNPMFKGSGFWDGTEVVSRSEIEHTVLQNDDSNHNPIVQELGTKTTIIGAGKSVKYTIRRDSYAIGNKNVKVKEAEYNTLVAKDAELKASGALTIMKPLVAYSDYLVDYEAELKAEKAAKEAAGEQTDLTDSVISDIIDKMTTYYNQNQNVWFKMTAANSKGRYSSNTFYPVLDSNKKVVSIYARMSGDYKDTASEYKYAEYSAGQYQIRVDYFDYFTNKNGFTPYYFFGSNAHGQDIFLRLALGARFSLLLGIGISAINLIIGLIWGAVSGYYGGITDLIMERVTDIISTIPSLIILTICSIQFTNNQTLKEALGDGIVVLAFLVAFVYSGWIGVAGTTRMQFYRFKGQEYVLASRSLGAKDSRLIFRHILPNAMGTLVTSTVLMIPGVIFSESSLSYLGIVNFSTSGLVSIGSLLSEGQAAGLQYYPHVLLFPCIIIALLMISFNLFGNGLRDAFNTTLKGSD